MLHAPLEEEGLWIRVLEVDHATKKICEIMYHVEFGGFILLRGDVFHSGHYGSESNVRLHGVVERKDLISKGEDSLYFLDTFKNLPMCPFKEYVHDSIEEKVKATELPNPSKATIEKLEGRMKKMVCANYSIRMKRYYRGENMVAALNIFDRHIPVDPEETKEVDNYLRRISE